MPDNTFFKIVKWDEKPYDEMDQGPKLTRASVSKSYEGAIEGEGSLEMTMMYRPDGSAVFNGMERVQGRVDGRSGSFVLLHSGTFEGGVVKDTWVVVPGSGTDDLRNLHGKAAVEHGHAERYPVRFDFHWGPGPTPAGSEDPNGAAQTRLG